MNVVFRVDSSVQMGAGHLMRCLTLADKLKKQSHQISFICRELAGNLISLIQYPVQSLLKDDSFRSDDLYLNWLGATQEEDAKQTINVIPEDVDALIVDSYALDEIWHKQLRLYTKKIVVIDDLANRNFDCDILLNQNIGAQKKDYKRKVSNNCKLLLGCDYALLRPEFSGLRARTLEKRRNTKEIKNILVSVGGSDVDNITYDILQQLDGGFNIVVVLGSSSPHNKMIENYAKDKGIRVVINAENMSELMFEADLAIGAGGSTSWERCCLGLPTLLFVTAENQRIVAEDLERLGAVIIVKNLKDDLQAIVGSFSMWQAMSKNTQTICDGLGVERIGI